MSGDTFVPMYFSLSGKDRANVYINTNFIIFKTPRQKTEIKFSLDLIFEMTRGHVYVQYLNAAERAGLTFERTATKRGRALCLC